MLSMKSLKIEYIPPNQLILIDLIYFSLITIHKHCKLFSEFKICKTIYSNGL